MELSLTLMLLSGILLLSLSRLPSLTDWRQQQSVRQFVDHWYAARAQALQSGCDQWLLIHEQGYQWLDSGCSQQLCSELKQRASGSWPQADSPQQLLIRPWGQLASSNQQDCQTQSSQDMLAEHWLALQPLDLMFDGVLGHVQRP